MTTNAPVGPTIIGGATPSGGVAPGSFEYFLALTGNGPVQQQAFASDTRTRTSKKAEAQQATIAGENTILGVQYGRRPIGAKIVSAIDYGGSLLLRCAWCEGEVDAIESITISGAASNLSGDNVSHYTGTTTQVVDPVLVTAYAAKGITYTDRMLGVAYSMLSFPARTKVQGFPQPVAMVRGLKVANVQNAYVDLSGTKYVSTPDTAQNDLSEDFVIEAGLTTTAWAGGALQTIVAKWGTTSGNRAFALVLDTAGKLRVHLNNALLATSSVAVPFSAGALGFVRAAVRKNNGSSQSDITFATSSFGVSWTTLGSVQTAAVISSINNSASPLTVGRDSDTGLQLTAKVYEVRITTATKLVAHFLPWQTGAASGSTWAGPAGETWTGQNAAVIAATYFQYSNTPANCLADFVRDAGYGLGKQVDFRHCLATYTLNAEVIGGEARHQIDLTLDAQQDPEVWLNVLADYAHCTISIEGDTYVFVRDWDDGAVMAFDATNVIQGSVRPSKRGARATPTVVEVTWTDPSTTPWKEAPSTEYFPGVLSGSVPRRVSKISKPGLTRLSEATRYRIEMLNEATLDDDLLEWGGFDEASKVRLGELVTVAHPQWGNLARTFRVKRKSPLGPGRWGFMGLGFDPAQYSSVVVTAPTVPDTALPSPANPPAPTGLAMVEEVYQDQTGYFASRWRVTWTDAAGTYPFVDRYQVTISQAGVIKQGPILAPGTATEFASQAMQEGLLYQADVAVVSTSGAAGTPAMATATNSGKLAKPGDVPSLTGYEIGGEVRVSWVPAIDLDLTGHELRYGAVGGLWSTATLLNRVATPSVRYATKDVPPGTWRFWIKGLDSVRSDAYPYGQESVNAATCDVTVTSDASAFQAASYAFVTPVLQSMVATVTGWVTDFGDTWNSLFTGTLSSYTSALSTYHAAGTSSYVTEAYDLGTATTGDFSVIPTYTDLSGVAQSYVELSGTGGEVGKTITGATNATPIVITATAHGYNSNDEVVIAAVGGNTAANGRFKITVTDADHFSLQTLAGVSVAGNGAYTSGGSSARWVWVTYSGQSAKSTARYARLRMATTGTLRVTALGVLRVNVVGRSDHGSGTSLASGATVVTASLHFNRASAITITPKGTASRSSVYDKVEVSGSRGVLLGYGLRFDSVDDFVTIPDSAPLSMTAAMTVEFWAKQDAANTYKTICSKWTYATQGGWVVQTDATGTELAFYIASSLTDGGSNYGKTATNSWRPGVWNHVAMVFDGSLSGNSNRLKVYINGILQTLSFGGTIPAALQDNTAPVNVGKFGGSLTRWFDGVVDEVRIWNTARTEAEINANMNLRLTGSESGLAGNWGFDEGTGTTALDNTGNANSGTLTGGPSYRPYDGFDVYIFNSAGTQVAADFSWTFDGA